jgi:ketosteroid isomerase-like protein
MTGQLSAGEVLDRFYGALEAGDVAAARARCAPDAVFWHSFDAVAQDLELAAKGWSGMVDHFSEHRVVDVRRQEIPGGLVQRHLLVLAGSGGRQGKPCCIFVTVRDGLITRLDEYVDLSGNLPLADGDATTPGLPRRAGVS